MKRKDVPGLLKQLLTLAAAAEPAIAAPASVQDQPPLPSPRSRSPRRAARKRSRSRDNNRAAGGTRGSASARALTSKASG